jgi:hypothetical protein
MQTRLSPVATVNAETRTVEMTWSTGAAVTRYDWWSGKRYIEELSMDPDAIRMDRLNGGAPLLNTHGRYDLGDVIGVVEKAWIENGNGRAIVRFSDREDVAGIWQDVQNGIIRNVSVGYAVHRYQIEERDNNLPIWRAVDWEPMEVSLVPVPADAGAGLRNQDSARLLRCEFITSTTQEVRTVEDETQTQDQGQEPASTNEEIRAAAEAAVAAERQRAAEIREAVRASQLGDELAEDFIARGISADEARREVLRRLAERSAAQTAGRMPHAASGGQDETQTRRDAIADAIAHRVMPQGQLSEPGRQYRYMSLLRLAEECLVATGVSVRGMAPLEIAARAMHTTSDFPAILANVMNKRLRQAYEQSQPTYRRWARRAPNAPDFKTIQVNQLSGAPDLLQVDEHGEFKYGKLSDGKETYAVATYGRIIAITRQAIVNDDLRAFDRLPQAFGMAANRLENRLVYQQLTANANMSDGVPLFHATHGNLAGSGGAISDTTLGAGRTGMRLQTGMQGEVLNIVPAFLIVPATKEQLAYQYTSANYVPAKQSDTSEFRAGGRTALEPIVEAELDASSTTAWYLAAEPGIVDTVEYCYLDGSEGAYLETGMDFDIDGMKLKARLDFATKVIDYRGLYKNAGA